MLVAVSSDEELSRMSIGLPSLIALAALIGIATLCLIGISRVRSQAVHERGRLMFSFRLC